MNRFAESGLPPDHRMVIATSREVMTLWESFEVISFRKALDQILIDYRTWSTTDAIEAAKRFDGLVAEAHRKRAHFLGTAQAQSKQAGRALPTDDQALEVMVAKIRPGHRVVCHLGVARAYTAMAICHVLARAVAPGPLALMLQTQRAVEAYTLQMIALQDAIERAQLEKLHAQGYDTARWFLLPQLFTDEPHWIAIMRAQ